MHLTVPRVLRFVIVSRGTAMEEPGGYLPNAPCVPYSVSKSLLREGPGGNRLATQILNSPLCQPHKRPVHFPQ